MYIDYLLNCKWPSNRLCKPRKVLLKLIGDVLKDSEWTQILAQAYAFTSGVAEKLLSASHIKKTPRSHQITLAALHIVF